MTELTLIFVFQASGILLSLVLARLSGTGAPLGAVRRIESALERAAATFLARALARLALVTVGAALVVAAVASIVSKSASGAFGAFGVIFGAVLAAGAAFLAATLLGRSNGAVIVAAERRFDLTLANALVPSGAAGVLAQALGALGALGMYLAELTLRDGSTTGEGAFVLASLPGYALGAGLAALVTQSAGGVYRAAAEGGAAAAARHERGLSAWDPRNPALVGVLVGDKLVAGGRAALVTATSAAATSLALVLASRVGGAQQEQVRFAALPLVLLAFGLIASATGVWVARPLEAEGAAPALLRGQLSATAIWSLGLAGACHWLFPECWLWLIGAGAVGLLASTLVPGALFALSHRRAPSVEDATDALRAGSIAAPLSALAGGLSLALVVLALGGAAAFGARTLGSGSGLAAGAALGLVTALAGVLALAPFAFAADGLASAGSSARAVGAMSGADTDTARRLTRLAESSQLPAALARCVLFTGAALATLAVCLLPQRAAAGPEALGDLLLPGWLSVLGAACLLGQAAAATRRAARAAGELMREVAKKLVTQPLAGESGDNGATSYRASEELCSRSGLSGALALAAPAGFLAVVLGSGLFLVYRVGGPRLAADALTMFVAGAAVTALGVALTVDGAHAVLAAARRASRPEADIATVAASVTGNALLSLVLNALGPTVCSLALIAGALALLASPLFP